MSAEAATRQVPNLCVEDLWLAGLTDPEDIVEPAVRDWVLTLTRGYADRVPAAAAKRVARLKTRKGLTVDNKGVPLKSQANVRLALEGLGVHLAHDTFAQRLIYEYDGAKGNVDDVLVEKLWLRVDDLFRFRPALAFFRIVLMDRARANPFHPVCDYLGSLRWDDVPRVDRWLVVYGEADDTPYVRAVGALVLIAAVRRVRQPGSKFDELPVLESPQGWDKSNALRTLCPRDDWFSDSLPLGSDAKRTIEGTAGVWIAEAADLQGQSRRDIDQLKAALSRQVDGPVRLAYGRLPVTVPRQFVAIGTTNKSAYLLDMTGNRRFWPVTVERFDLDALRRDRDQLWAEAAHREAEGESIRLRQELWPKAEQEQEARRVEDPWEEILADRLGGADGKALAAGVWEIVGVPQERRTQADNERLGAVMRRLGFRRVVARFGGKPRRMYRRGESELLLPELRVNPNA